MINKGGYIMGHFLFSLIFSAKALSEEEGGGAIIAIAIGVVILLMLVGACS